MMLVGIDIHLGNRSVRQQDPVADPVRNLLPQSTSFATNWMFNGSPPVEHGALPSPAGPATRVAASGLTHGPYWNNAVAGFASGEVITFSVHYRHESGSEPRLRLQYAGSAFTAARIGLVDTGTLVPLSAAGTGASLAAEPVPGWPGWLRARYQITTERAGAVSLVLYSGTASAQTFLLSGPMLERGSLTPYQAVSQEGSS